MLKENEPQTTFWQKLTIGLIVYCFVGAVMLGAAGAHHENKCGFIRKTSAADDAISIFIWLPGVIGWAIETNNGVPLCQTIVK